MGGPTAKFSVDISMISPIILIFDPDTAVANYWLRPDKI